MKKHLREKSKDESGSKKHREVLRLLACSECLKHSKFDDEGFLPQHSQCTKQLKTNNPTFLKWINGVAEEYGQSHNLAEAYLSDDSEEEVEEEVEEEEGEDDVSIITESSETAAAVSSIQVADQERDNFIQVVVEKAKAKEGESKEVEAKEGEMDKAKEGEVEKEVEDKRTEDAKKSKKAKKIGITIQSQKWDKDLEAAEVSRKQYLETMYKKYRGLESRHKVALEECNALKLKEIHNKADKEEANFLRAANRAKTLELAQAQAKIANLEARLSFANAEVSKAQEADAESKKELMKVKEEKEMMKREEMRREIERMHDSSQHYLLHVPMRNAAVADNILCYGVEEEEVECYEGVESDVSCLHISLTRKGRRLEAKSYNIRKRRCRPSDVHNPTHAHKRSRVE